MLVHPQIPQNAGMSPLNPAGLLFHYSMKNSLSATGNIARTAAAAGVPLHLVEPIGESIVRSCMPVSLWLDWLQNIEASLM